MVYPDLNQEWGGWMLSPWNFVAVQHVALGYTVFLFGMLLKSDTILSAIMQFDICLIVKLPTVYKR